MPGDNTGNSCQVLAALQQPAPLQREGNVATNWREWKLSFDYFLLASGKDSVTSKEKCALFMHVIGQFGREIYDELELHTTEKDNYEILCTKFAQYCEPEKNVNFERHIFFEIYQDANPFDKFLSALKLQSKHCEFGNLKNSLILTQLIRGLKDVHMREKLLAKSKLTLEEATQWCRAAAQAGEQAVACSSGRSASNAASMSVEQLGRGGGGGARYSGGARQNARGQQRSRPRGGGGGAPWRGQRAPQRERKQNDSVCGKCNYEHSATDKCPAATVRCYRCERFGHFAKCCRVKFTREVLSDKESQQGEDDSCDTGELLMFNICIDALNGARDSWCAALDVNGVRLVFKLDSGADASVMSLHSYINAGFDVSKLSNCKTILREISKKRLPVVGYFNALLQYNNRKSYQKIYVLDVNCNNLLSLKACVSLQIIARCDVQSINSIHIDESIFEGIGCLPNECKILINDNVQPVVNATRKIPLKLRPRLKQELQRMENLEIIKKEDAPTDWVSSIVVVEKSNKNLRICLDPKNLNRAIKRSHFQLPTLDENGFWMIKLSNDSSKLCTFSTPFGRYRFLRLPFGVNCGPELFHKEMYNIFKMEGVEVYIDDVLIWGRSKKEHDERLKEVIRRAKANGVKFNKDKCVFNATEIDFLGHTFNSSGMKPNTSRVTAILNMPKPKDKKELERFLGVTNYLSRFIPKYSDLSAPLRQLLSKNSDFIWSHEHEKAYEVLISKISSAPVLRFYSPNEQVTVSVDSSSRGLGACLLQGGRPVAYAARTLTPTETRWAQIEKELLAVVFGCLRFHQYVYGHDKIIVESDHKPLEMIFKKQLNETPPRLQRMLLKLQQYNIELHYKPGKYMFIPDTLSRATVEAGLEEDVSQDVTVHVNTLYENVEASPEMLVRLREATSNDIIFTKLINYYKEGWPNNKRQVHESVGLYWNVHNELHVVNGILFRNERVVIPQTLREEMLIRIHEGHLGVEKCQRRARDVMWWPGMSADIARVVLNCETCQRHRAANPREPLAPHAVPLLPWHTVAADVFEFRGKQHLLVVDYYSKYVEIATLNNLMCSTAITAFKNIFCRFGIPKKLVTDNATQFSAQEFKKFSLTWGFTHETSSPMYPRSNGLAERNVRTVKELLTKSFESGEDWQLALLNFRNTPLTGEQHSPAQLLMGRRLNTRLPAGASVLQPRIVESRTVKSQRCANNVNSKKYYDRGTRTLPPLKNDQKIRMRNRGTWEKAKVIRKARGDRSYWVETENGGVYRRNRQHLLNLPVSAQAQTELNLTKYANVDWDHVCNSTLNQHGPSTFAGSTGVSSQSNRPFVTRAGRIVHPPDRYVCE